MRPKSKVRTRRKISVPKECFLCKENKNPIFKDVEVLRRVLTERGKIIGRARSGVCSKHQKDVTIAIKQARHLALLPYTAGR